MAALLVAATVPPAGATAQQPVPASPGALRRAAHGMALARIGRSGLRSLISASGSLGDLRNRAASYDTAEQLEQVRTGSLNGRIAALESALQNPALPDDQRASLTALRIESLEELVRIPRYEAAYQTATAQTEMFRPAGFVGSHPLFLLVRARGHARWGGGDALTVFSEAVSAGPVVVRDRWFLSSGLSVGRTDVSVGHFDGSGSTNSLSAVLGVGRVLGDDWSAAAQLTWNRAWSGSNIMRPGPDGPTEVQSEERSRATSAKLEVKGSVGLAEPAGVALRLRPRAGAFLTSTRVVAREVRDGETGPIGVRETLAALRVGASVEASVGSWTPSILIGWEQELGDDGGRLIDDPGALLGSVTLSRAWGRGRRVSLEYAFLHGLHGLRSASELTLVLILDD